MRKDDDEESKRPRTIPDNNAPKDVLALKFNGRQVYVWRGPKKGWIGRVRSIGGEHAQVEFTGVGTGCVIETLKRENLIR